MKLKLVELHFILRFNRPAYIDIYSAFALRSVLGYHLKRMHCVTSGGVCEKCPYSRTCAYSYLFESPIEKDTAILPGRDRASHPFRIISISRPNEIVSEMGFKIQLFGDGINYIPHVIYAFIEASKQGLFHSRTLFRTEVFNMHGMPIKSGDEIMLEDIPIESLSWSQDISPVEGSFFVECLSPLRFKVQGRYGSEFRAFDFLEACMRRLLTLFSFYGDQTDTGPMMLTQPWRESALITDRNLQWVDYSRYSRRQGVSMKMGGYVGNFVLSGIAEKYMWDTLGICSKIGVGKNTSFGFGEVCAREVRHE